jgi:hypothetical protein
MPVAWVQFQPGALQYPEPLSEAASSSCLLVLLLLGGPRAEPNSLFVKFVPERNQYVVVVPTSRLETLQGAEEDEIITHP